jgi:hypothetical protein
MADAEDDGSRTPKQSDAQRPKSKGNSSIDPALRGEEGGSDSASTPAATSEVDDKRQEEWVENIRLIEALRKWVGERLKVGDYDNQEGDAEGQAQEGASANVDLDSKTAETAKMITEKLRGALNEANKQEAAAAAEAAAGSDVNYPNLSSA